MSTCQARSSLPQHIPWTGTQNQHGQHNKSQLKTGHDPAKSRHICAHRLHGTACQLLVLGDVSWFRPASLVITQLSTQSPQTHNPPPPPPPNIASCLASGAPCSPPLVTACAHWSPLTPLSPLHWSPPSPLLASVHVPRALPGSQLSTDWAGGR